MKKRESLDFEPAQMPDQSPGDSSADMREASSTVLDRLRSFIEDGAYPPGARLPPERELAAEFGVGRPAVREALKALSILDVVESRRGDGTYVKSAGVARLAWPVHIAIQPESFNALELLEVRKMIEPRACWLAAARATQDQLRDIEVARRTLEAEGNSCQMVVKLDMEFHTAILRAAQNPVLDRINEFLTPLMIQSRSITARFAENRSGMHADHKAIVDAIFQGQSDAAERAMMAHLQRVGLDLVTSAGE
ncbi:MAG: FadR/GntR family transcriptional regulator [Bryobacteraceae bacterium]|jgi:DNA-binding FadR family transcriptional regulator